ncbi:ADP-ribosylglycohydrolase family protein [Paraburkholderia sp. LEh10]|uniref:ADP-ribosylglycohydrolase family protein n=1 Tax=Paraburkholderia sp. LEh10 TaxID=2821353 RepID=UPI001AE0ECBB|nr:ADP-ribosylglycohydrolase family protein [Paraburkholderia sp. LEh10]MBP0595680.1 ADP-ribosylglycohydrolase family protein [Paraburkholderia sp. LEh10]
MRGAVVGDVSGSSYEGSRALTREEDLFGPGSTVTDDSVCTVAIAEAVLNDVSFAQSLQVWGRAYPNAGYGGAFRRWLFEPGPQPYGSFGNGALMRVSPTVALSDSLDHALAQARAATEVTHNHPIALKAVDTYVSALWAAILGEGHEAVCSTIEASGTSAHDVEVAHREYLPRIRADETLEDVLSCLRNANSFESLMRECLFHGGDTDTICAVAGAIGEALWGIPLSLLQQALAHVPERLTAVLVREYDRLSQLHPHLAQ